MEITKDSMVLLTQAEYKQIKEEQQQYHQIVKAELNDNIKLSIKVGFYSGISYSLYFLITVYCVYRVLDKIKSILK